MIDVPRKRGLLGGWTVDDPSSEQLIDKMHACGKLDVN